MSKDKKARELNEEEIKNVSGGYRGSNDRSYVAYGIKGLSRKEAELLESARNRYKNKT